MLLIMGYEFLPFHVYLDTKSERRKPCERAEFIHRAFSWVACAWARRIVKTKKEFHQGIYFE
jgi:hypothetical protein